MARVRERRRRQRVDVALPIKIGYNSRGIKAQSKNISVLGTYLEADKEIPIGTTLNIKIKIPKTGAGISKKSKEIGCLGIAFRCQPISSSGSKKQFGIGIFFRSFLEKGEQNLSSYIDHVLLQEKEIGKVYMRKRKQGCLRPGGGKR